MDLYRAGLEMHDILPQSKKLSKGVIPMAIIHCPSGTFVPAAGFHFSQINQVEEEGSLIKRGESIPHGCQFGVFEYSHPYKFSPDHRAKERLNRL